MGQITESIRQRVWSIIVGATMLHDLFEETNVEHERPRLANDLYDIDAQIWGLVRDIEQYRANRPKQKEGE